MFWQPWIQLVPSWHPEWSTIPIKKKYRTSQITHTRFTPFTTKESPCVLYTQFILSTLNYTSSAWMSNLSKQIQQNWKPNKTEHSEQCLPSNHKHLAPAQQKKNTFITILPQKTWLSLLYNNTRPVSSKLLHHQLLIPKLEWEADSSHLSNLYSKVLSHLTKNGKTYAHWNDLTSVNNKLSKQF